MDSITKQAIIWVIIIIFGGGIVSALLGQGFWGEKRPQTTEIRESPKVDDGWTWGFSGPNQNEKCDTTKQCKECHPDK